MVYYLPPPLGCALYEELQAFRGLLEMPGAWYDLLVGDQENDEKKMYASGLQQLRRGEEQGAAWQRVAGQEECVTFPGSPALFQRCVSCWVLAGIYYHE